MKLKTEDEDKDLLSDTDIVSVLIFLIFILTESFQGFSRVLDVVMVMTGTKMYFKK